MDEVEIKDVTYQVHPVAIPIPPGLEVWIAEELESPDADGQAHITTSGPHRVLAAVIQGGEIGGITEIKGHGRSVPIESLPAADGNLVECCDLFYLVVRPYIPGLGGGGTWVSRTRCCFTEGDAEKLAADLQRRRSRRPTPQRTGAPS